MSAQELITEHLDLWTGAVTKKSSSARGSSGKVELTGVKKLRELILELAIRGKLVDQIPTSEPVDELLKQLERCKVELQERWGVRKPKPLSGTNTYAPATNLPEGWASVFLDNVGITQIGLTYSPKNLSIRGTPVLRSSNIQNGKLDFTDLVRVEAEVPSSIFVEEGDLLICARNGSKALVGKTAMIAGLSEPMTFGAFMAIFRSPINPYVQVFLNSPMFREELEGTNTTTINQITQNKLRSTRLPLPPLEEQHRIVQKVDELMALCDRLEQQTSDQLEAHETLVDTLLGTLTQSASAIELADNWARLAAHFDTLFTTEQSIEKLKETILQLAVMGRLVAHKFNSEDSAAILKRAKSKQEQLVQQGKLKGGDKRCSPQEIDPPFDLPANWSWARVSELLPDFQNGASSRGDDSGSEVIVLRLADIKNLKISLDDPRRLLISNSSISKYTVRSGDILIIRVNGSSDLVGRFVPVETPFDGIFCDHFIRMRIDSEIINPRFLTLVGSTNSIRSRIEDLFVSTAGQKTVNQKHISSLLIPLPPIEEQHRIVQKVDELMTLCDRLLEGLNLASSTRFQLAEGLVGLHL